MGHPRVDTGIEHEDVEAAESLDRRAEQSGDLRLDRDIRRDELSAHRLRNRYAVGASPRNHDRCPCIHEPLGVGPPDAGGAAGDQRPLAFKAESLVAWSIAHCSSAFTRHQIARPGHSTIGTYLPGRNDICRQIRIIIRQEARRPRMRTLKDVTRQVDHSFARRLIEVLECEPAPQVEAAFATLDVEYSAFSSDPTVLEPGDLIAILHHLNGPSRFPGICLRFGRTRQILDLGLVGYTALSCSTIGDALEVVLRYHDLTSNAYRVQFAEQDDWVVVDLWIRPAHRGHHQILAEEFATGLWQFLSEVSPESTDLRQIRLEFDFPAPVYAADYFELMPATIRFDQARTSFAVPAHWQSTAIETADETVALVCRAQCDELIAGLTPGPQIVDDVRQTILSVPGNRPPHLAGVAKEMMVSTRTLERRLHEAGTTFREIANEVRMQLAAQYVALGTMSSDQISRMLGYSQPSAFFRAFKHRFGTTPKRYRSGRLAAHGHLEYPTRPNA